MRFFRLSDGCFHTNLPAAEQQLTLAQAQLCGANSDALHLYHRNMGFLHGIRGDSANSLAHLLLALDVEGEVLKADTSLSANIGLAYAQLGKPFHAILHLERALAVHNDKHIHAMTPLVGITHAACYMYTGDLVKARKLWEIALSQAMSINHDITIGTVLYNLALLSMKEKNPSEGIALCDQALTHLHQDPERYMMALVHKAQCLLESKDLAGCTEVLKQGLPMAEGNEMFTILFESLGHRMTLNDAASANYIENIAIPRLKNTVHMYTALDYCDILEAHYRKNRSIKKAQIIGCMSRDILRGIVFSSPSPLP